MTIEGHAGGDHYMHYDYVIIGGGFFGSRIALQLARDDAKVLLLEREASLLRRASYANQARVHGGYHYPRNLLTALRSRVNLPVFAEEYSDCVDSSFTSYYAIASNFSKVSAEQFRLFCERIKAPVKRAPSAVRNLFNRDLIDDVVEVEEYAFDADKLRRKMEIQLDMEGVQIRLGADALRIDERDGELAVTFVREGRTQSVSAREVINCGYSRINKIHRSSHVPEVPLKHEIAEIALIEPPEELEGRGVTVMDGPFFSTTPFPARALHSLTHVRYTPHTEWRDGEEGAPGDPYKFLKGLELKSTYAKMLADAKRYLPCMAGAKYVQSLYEVKTVLPKSEDDDSRPILFRRNHGMPGYTCVMGAKLDNIYDVMQELVPV